MVALLGFLLVTSGSPVAAQGLSKIEQQIVLRVDADVPAARALLERVVNINSGTMNFEGVHQVGALFRTELNALGFITRWEDGAAFGRAGHLIAERGHRGPTVLLIGHLDTVFEQDSPFQHYQQLSDTAARGPGIIDMKGGDVVLVQALKALAGAGLLDRLTVRVALMGDEESTGEPKTLARMALTQLAQGAGYALGFEDADGSPERIVVARRGTTAWTLKVVAASGHSSQIFRSDIGDGAIFEAARIINTFRERMGGEQYLTFSPGLMVGGTTAELTGETDRGAASGKDNVIAAQVVATGDIRTISVEQRENAKASMRSILADSLPHTSAEISFVDGYPPMAPTPGNTRLLQDYDRVSRDLGFGPVTALDPSRAGAADVSFVSGIVPAIVDGLGLKGQDDHTVHETADLTTLPVQIKRAAVLLARIGEAVP
jgi:glutamate carboxypeptidase